VSVVIHTPVTAVSASIEISSSPVAIDDHPVAGIIQVPDPGPTWPARIPSRRAMRGRGQLRLIERPDAVDSGQRPEPERRYVPSNGFVDDHTDVSRRLMQGSGL
jgi:hypothetical protein